MHLAHHPLPKPTALAWALQSTPKTNITTWQLENKLKQLEHRFKEAQGMIVKIVYEKNKTPNQKSGVSEEPGIFERHRQIRLEK